MDEEDQYNAEAGSSRVVEMPATENATQTEGNQPTISKNAMKKAARQARMAELKPLKRQAEKVRRQARAHELSSGYADGTLSEADKEIFEQRRAREREKRNAKKLEKVAKLEGGNSAAEGSMGVWGGAVIMDLGFDELMTENEIASMDSQLSFAYSVNRLSALPFSALIHTSGSTSSSPRLIGRLANRGIERWSRCHWYADSLDTLAQQMQAGGEEELPSGLKRGEELVYLSADSGEELTALSENEVYIIGGLVDRNRHKMLCQNKAERLGIRTARLPIGTYIENLPTRKVLTVNQVFAILVEFNIRKDWKAAFEAVIPPRKFVEKKRKRSKTGGEQGDTPGREDEEEEEDEDMSEDGGPEAAEKVGDASASGPVEQAAVLSDEEAAMNA